jgi:hypothetical protein
MSRRWQTSQRLLLLASPVATLMMATTALLHGQNVAVIDVDRQRSTTSEISDSSSDPAEPLNTRPLASASPSRDADQADLPSESTKDDRETTTDERQLDDPGEGSSTTRTLPSPGAGNVSRGGQLPEGDAGEDSAAPKVQGIESDDGPRRDGRGGGDSAGDGESGAGPSPRGDEESGAGSDPDEGGDSGERVPEPEIVVDWQRFGGHEFSLDPGGRQLLVQAPTASYEDLGGIFARRDSLCDFRLSFSARMSGDTSTPGFGYGVGLRTSLEGGVPKGWSLQYEWDADSAGYYYRHVILPDQAYEATDSRPVAGGSGESVPWEIEARGKELHILVNGEETHGHHEFPINECGGGILFRVWGGSVVFDDVTLTRL